VLKEELEKADQELANIKSGREGFVSKKEKLEALVKKVRPAAKRLSRAEYEAETTARKYKDATKAWGAAHEECRRAGVCRCQELEDLKEKRMDAEREYNKAQIELKNARKAAMVLCGFDGLEEETDRPWPG
jgi:chromosome segregation ATPase